MGCWSFKIIDLNEIREKFETIPNVRVVKVFYDDVDLDWVGAVIIIDENKLLVIRYIQKKHFSENRRDYIAIGRIGNYRVSTYSYYLGDKRSLYRSGLVIGGNSMYNKLFNLGEINGIENVIKNYDLILNAVEQLPDDDVSLLNPHNNYGFWNPDDLESKSNLLHYTFSDGKEGRIGKIKLNEIIDYSILDENIDHWDLLRFN
jgi:hypothetical protein